MAEDPRPDENAPETDENAAETAQDEAAAAADESAGSDHLSTQDIEKLLDDAAETLEQAADEETAPETSSGGSAAATSGSATADGETASGSAEPSPFELGDLTPEAAPAQRQPMELLGEVELNLRVELGRTRMRLEEVLQLRPGSVVALDRLAGDPVDIYVNGRLIARGEVLVMNDNFCVRVTELVSI